MTENKRLPQEGDIIDGKYLVNEVLGRGGMGLVLGATHTKLDQRVAIKFLTEEADPEMKRRFNREARASAKLKSEHVARVYDVGELDDGTPFMVMEYLQGGDLGKVVKVRGILPVEEALGYFLQACEAIAEAHSVGIIHRDLKPPNLFLAENPDGTVTLKVLDFGISKDRAIESLSKTAEGDLTKTSMMLGTPHYMAPEQMRSAKDVDTRADIWSLGAILYQLLTGERPFRGGSFPELVVRVIQEQPEPPTQLRPELAPEIETVILRCLAKEPVDRYANVAVLCRALAPYGPPQSFARAEKMERMLGLAPRSSAPVTSVPPSSLPPPGGTPRSQRSIPSWMPDTAPETGGPTEAQSRRAAEIAQARQVAQLAYADTMVSLGPHSGQPSVRTQPPGSGVTATVQDGQFAAITPPAQSAPSAISSYPGELAGNTEMTAEKRVLVDSAITQGGSAQGRGMRIGLAAAAAALALVVLGWVVIRRSNDASLATDRTGLGAETTPAGDAPASAARGSEGPTSESQSSESGASKDRASDSPAADPGSNPAKAPNDPSHRTAPPSNPPSEPSANSGTQPGPEPPKPEPAPVPTPADKTPPKPQPVKPDPKPATDPQPPKPVNPLDMELK